MNNRISYTKHLFGPNDIQNVIDVLNNGWIARGPLVQKFEDQIAKKYNYRHVVACSSGSTALDIVLRSLKLEPADEVIVPSITWAATASCVKLAGANPVFADIDIDTICVTSNTIEEQITPRTKAIIVVHFAGRPCDMQPIWELADRYSFHVIEDSAHAFGSSYKCGAFISSSLNTYASTFSFHPAKNMTTAEGGLITTQHSELLDIFRLMRSGGVSRRSDNPFQKANYTVDCISSNYHLSELHAAIGLGQLEVVEYFISKRRALSAYYLNCLEGIPGLILPPCSDESSWNLFIIRLSSPFLRDKLFESLHSQGIGAYFHYPCLHKFTKAYSSPVTSLPSSEKYSDTAITLPIGPHLDFTDIDIISQAIRDCLFSS